MRVFAMFLLASAVACSSKGDAGPQGSAGPQGPKGDTGATGASGPAGPSLWVVDTAPVPPAKVGPVVGYTRATSSSSATVSFFANGHVWTYSDVGAIVPPPACAFYYTTSNCSGTPYVSLSGGSAGTCAAGRFDLFLHKNSGSGNAWAVASAAGTPNSNVASNDNTGTCTTTAEQITAVATTQLPQLSLTLGHLDIQQF